jgi:pimeloyl-ACP methyl ester carboxylesterase
VLGWPGFGDVPLDPTVDSLAALYRWLLERLPKEPSHVIAQSMGGVLAARLALDHPERLARLVLVATSGGLDLAKFGAVDWRPEYLLSPREYRVGSSTTEPISAPGWRRSRRRRSSSGATRIL